MAICHDCSLDMSDRVSCTGTTLVVGGRVLRRRRATRRYGHQGCGDCAAPPRGYHHLGCDLEPCPACGGQLLSCGCLDGGWELRDGSGRLLAREGPDPALLAELGASSP